MTKETIIKNIKEYLEGSDWTPNEYDNEFLVQLFHNIDDLSFAWLPVAKNYADPYEDEPSGYVQYFSPTLKKVIIFQHSVQNYWETIEELAEWIEDMQAQVEEFEKKIEVRGNK